MCTHNKIQDIFFFLVIKVVLETSLISLGINYGSFCYYFILMTIIIITIIVYESTSGILIITIIIIIIIIRREERGKMGRPKLSKLFVVSRHSI